MEKALKNQEQTLNKEKELWRSIPNGKFKSGRVWKEKSNK